MRRITHECSEITERVFGNDAVYPKKHGNAVEAAQIGV